MLSKGGVPKGYGTLIWYAGVFVIRGWCRSVEGDVIGTYGHPTFMEQSYALTDVRMSTGAVHARGGGKAARHRGVINSIVPQDGGGVRGA